MIRRAFYAVFVVLGGFIFIPIKWLLMGTKGSRQRKKILKQQKELLKRSGG